LINFDNFKRSLKALELQYENHQTLDETFPQLTDLIREGVAESVIQRFETCYDSLWKVTKRYLTEELGIPDVPNSPRGIFRLADENNLFQSHIDKWIAYSRARIDTSHDYSEEKAKRALAQIGPFIDDAIHLYETLCGKAWE